MTEPAFSEPHEVAFYLLKMLQLGVEDVERGAEPAFTVMGAHHLVDAGIAVSESELLVFWPVFIAKLLTRAYEAHGLDINPWLLIDEVKADYDAGLGEQLSVIGRPPTDSDVDGGT